MPSEHPPLLVVDQVNADHHAPSLTPATKLCTACNGPANTDPAGTGQTPIVIAIDEPSTLDDQSVFCATCRPRLAAHRSTQDQESAARRQGWQRPVILRVDTDLPLERSVRQPSAQEQRSAVEAQRIDQQAPLGARSPCVIATASAVPAPTTTTTTTSTAQAVQRVWSTEATSPSIPTRSLNASAHASTSLIQPTSEKTGPSKSTRVPSKSYDTLLDPLVDITRLRIRSRGYHCLYPGATFSGLQKSGKSSYDVTVTIVDVDMTSSFLCGYLCIRGLTDDWPEMTTYFDAEIIGSRHGFLTQKWGANESEDMMHWNKFPPFRHAKHELGGSSLTMPDRDRGAVFMRWKERFLVPDHRVQDISGASFAGFYYVCVDFNPQSSAHARPPAVQRGPSEGESSFPPKQESPHRARAPAMASSMSRRSSSYAAGSRGTATMSGFYYHQNSEPYQQLSLQHVQENSTSCFEFR